MRRYSKKRARLNAKAQPFRKALLTSVGRCEVCGHDPLRVAFGAISWALHVHEIARGSAYRVKAMDKPFATLVVCYPCHNGPLASRAEWPASRQLAALRRSRPDDYDLAAYNALIGGGPYYISKEDVDQWDE